MLRLVHGNSATATSSSKCTGNSATATKLQNARNIALKGAVTGSANFDGSSNVTITTNQANIAVLTGDVSVDPASKLDLQDSEQWGLGQAERSYPSGFSSTNCVVLSIGKKVKTNSLGFSFEGIVADLGDIQRNVFPIDVLLRNDKILVSINNPMPQKLVISYKIVLMKVS